MDTQDLQVGKDGADQMGETQDAGYRLVLAARYGSWYGLGRVIELVMSKHVG